MGPSSPRLLAGLATLALVVLALPAAAQTTGIAGSPDIHVDQAGTIVGPADVSADVEVVMPALADLGPLPDGAEVSGFTTDGATLRYFTLGHMLTLPGGAVAKPRDIVVWDGATYSVALDGGAVGFPDGSAIDALSFQPVLGEIWISFDTTVDLGGSVFRDADVFNDAFVRVFDATAAGVPPGMDVDAVAHPSGGSDLLLSFDVGGTLGGVAFADEDVLRYDPGTNTWSMEIDVSALQPGWAAADLDAMSIVPEPGFASGLVAALAWLGVLARRARR